MSEKRLHEFGDMLKAAREHRTDMTVQKLRDELSRVAGKYDRLLADYENLGRETSFITSIDLDKLAPIVVKPHVRGDKDEVYPLLICSDWHVMETVRTDQVNNLNEYDTEIATKSIKRLFSVFGKLITSCRLTAEVSQIGIALLGDMITNMLHDDQKEMNAGTPQEEVLFCLELIKGGIDFLLEDKKIKKIQIFCCDGNHGRDDKNKRKANRVKHSYEWLMYRFLQILFAEEPRVEFSIATGYLLYAEIYGRTVRMHHGDEVKYNGGVGGITIPMNKAISEWDKGKRADLDIFGHFHSFTNPTKFLSNGSVLGYSPYALSIKAPFEYPMQAVAVFEKHRFLQTVHRVYVR
jgi:hypothetical protein